MTFVLFLSPLLTKTSFFRKKEAKQNNFYVNEEILTIIILFHTSGIRCFKHSYISYAQQHLKVNSKYWFLQSFYWINAVKRIALTLFLKAYFLGKSSDISFVASTPIQTRKNKRIHSKKGFKNMATISKSSTELDVSNDSIVLSSAKSWKIK
jgi:hypothetical protein